MQLGRGDGTFSAGVQLLHFSSAPVAVVLGDVTGDGKSDLVVALTSNVPELVACDALPPYALGIVAGIASGAAMLPYTVIKEANAPEHAGTATGVVNFLNFTFSALLGPAFGWLLTTVTGDAAQRELTHYQTTFQPLLYGVILALALTLLLKETGPAGARSARVAAST